MPGDPRTDLAASRDYPWLEPEKATNGFGRWILGRVDHERATAEWPILETRENTTFE
jgi:hypothetical protein